MKSRVGIIASALAELSKLRSFTEVCRAGLVWSQDAQDRERRAKQLEQAGGPSSQLQLGLLGASIHVREYPKPFSAQKLTDFANEQFDAGFPFLYRLETVWLCTLVETTVHDLATVQIRSEPKVRGRKKIKNLKGTLVDFMDASEEAKAEKLMHALRDSLDAEYGIARSEALLLEVGLGGTLHAAHEKLLKEMYATRNVIVHQAGKADQRFADKCPWVPCQPGEELPLNDQTVNAYERACVWYVFELDKRIDPTVAGVETEWLIESTEAFFLRRRESANAAAQEAQRNEELLTSLLNIGNPEK